MYYKSYNRRRAAWNKSPSPKASLDDFRSVYSTSTLVSPLPFIIISY
jgi:hypothetical protein